MKKSIPLKEIVGYLPYGLKCYAQGMSTADTEFDEYPEPQEFEIVGLDVKYVSIYEEGRTVTEEMEYCDIIPHVRPLSDLTKPITHNGETFVPIVELFKIAINVKDPNFKVKELKIDDDFYCIVALDNKNQEIVFGFDNQDKSFGIFYENKTYSVFNQLELFDKMHEYLIDFRDWIKDGLAVDLNTL